MLKLSQVRYIYNDLQLFPCFFMIVLSIPSARASSYKKRAKIRYSETSRTNVPDIYVFLYNDSQTIIFEPKSFVK